MSSKLARLSLPLLVAALACGESPSKNEGGPSGGTGFGATAGASAATGGSPAGGGTGGASPVGGTAGSVAGGSGDAGAAGTGAGAGGDGASGTSGAGASSGGAGGMGGAGSSAGGSGGIVGGSSGLAGAGAGGAGSGDMYVSGVTVTVHPEVRTILVVNWTQTVAADYVYLEFTFENGNVMTSRAKPGTVGMHRDVALGIPAMTPTTIRVVSRASNVDYKTRDYTGTTGALPSGLPVATVMYNAAIASPNRWLFGAVENSTGGCNNSQCFYHTVFWLYIMDRQGRMVWYYSDAASNATSSFQRIAKDGEYIWIEKRPFGGGGSRSVLKRTLDGYYSESIPIEGLADAIDVTSDGGLLYDANNTLRERTRAGVTRDIFNCRTYWASGSCYTNTINWNPRDNTVLMSYPDRDTVLEVSRTTANMVVGQYGMMSGSYSFATTPPPPPPETTWQFGYQHFANISKDGTLLVSSHLNAAQATNQPVAGQHAFMEFSIDRTNRRLTNVWFYNTGQEWPMYKGMVIKLANNNYLANYGTGGVIREITPDKQTAFYVKFDAPAGTSGNDFFNKMVGHNELIDDLYALNGGGPPP